MSLKRVEKRAYLAHNVVSTATALMVMHALVCISCIPPPIQHITEEDYFLRLQLQGRIPALPQVEVYHPTREGPN